MIFAIDIDGTITKAPERMLKILEAFPGSFILTGYSGPPGDTAAGWESDTYKQLLAERRRQLAQLSVSFAQHEVVIAVAESIEGIGRRKAQICLERKVDVLIDDHPVYCHWAMKNRFTTVLMMR